MRKLLQIFLPALVCAVLALGCNKEKAGDQPAQDYDDGREGVIKAVQSGELKPDNSGAVALPDKWKNQSMNGQVYVAKNPTAGLLVLFPLMKGSGAIECMLYAEKGLPPGPGTTQVGQMTVKRTGQSSGKYYRATIATGPGR